MKVDEYGVTKFKTSDGSAIHLNEVVAFEMNKRVIVAQVASFFVDGGRTAADLAGTSGSLSHWAVDARILRKATDAEREDFLMQRALQERHKKEGRGGEGSISSKLDAHRPAVPSSSATPVASKDRDERFPADFPGRVRKLGRASNRAYRFLCGLNLQDHSVAEQREYLEVVRELGEALQPDRRELQAKKPEGK